MTSKGSDFEREFCRRLTVWWTNNPDCDVIFWRTSQSGGRATARRKNKKDTARSHCGDVCALDAVGRPLTDLITFELKRGYARHTVYDLLDKPAGAAAQEWERWVLQAQEAKRNADTPYWMIVARRDRREAVVCMPHGLYEQLRAWGARPLRHHVLHASLDVDGCQTRLVLTTLDHWFECVTPGVLPKG